MAALALTLDDGPDAAATGPMLDVLAEHGARATFFPIADRAARHPELIERMVKEGHTVGVHCREHVRHSQRDRAWGRADAAHSLAVLRELGCRPALWRTPWGDVAPWTAEVARENELELVAWDVDTHDWRGDDAETMFAATQPDLRAGAVILAHDGIGPGARRTHARETATYLRRLIAHAAATGLSLESL